MEGRTPAELAEDFFAWLGGAVTSDISSLLVPPNMTEQIYKDIVKEFQHNTGTSMTDETYDDIVKEFIDRTGRVKKLEELRYFVITRLGRVYDALYSRPPTGRDKVSDDTTTTEDLLASPPPDRSLVIVFKNDQGVDRDRLRKVLEAVVPAEHIDFEVHGGLYGGIDVKVKGVWCRELSLTCSGQIVLPARRSEELGHGGSAS
ncbi:hypothetical protein B0H66DRAFT_607491 [Apodospora peruviana]|uniref:Uncharacterized protein n=1 Tax=Apodospora peruviana TaxID=516989 RepID=A0AAE0HWP1_9PEZI|nr:hypothetical protein B0H66DRAFT_607491 [Apodospora peruviana]